MPYRFSTPPGEKCGLRQADVDTIIALFDWKGLGTVVKSGGLACQWIVIRAVPWAA
jgi:hypothetical protein